MKHLALLLIALALGWLAAKLDGAPEQIQYARPELPPTMLRLAPGVEVYWWRNPRVWAAFTNEVHLRQAFVSHYGITWSTNIFDNGMIFQRVEPAKQ